MPNLLDDNSLEQGMRAAKEYADNKINSLGDIAILIKGDKGEMGPQGEPGSYTETGSKSMPIYIDSDGMARPIESGHAYSLGIGYGALSKNSELYNTAFGYKSLLENTTGYRNVAYGSDSLQQNMTGHYNTAIGHATLSFNQAGSNNTALGVQALYRNETGNNTAIGSFALTANTTGDGNTAIGMYAQGSNDIGRCNVAIGHTALRLNISGNHNTAVGYAALRENFDNFSHCSGLGTNAEVTGHYQVQLGSSGTTTYAYGAIQNRSDIRDKANIMDMEYPYRDFILGLRSVTFQWDYREDYRNEPVEVDNPDHIPDDPTSQETITQFDTRKLSDIIHDGTHIRSRRHGGFIAQEVKALADSLGFDFSGYQDHSINGGDDVLSLGYEAFIPPLIATVQDQDKEIKDLKTMATTLINKNEELEARIIQLERR